MNLSRMPALAFAFLLSALGASAAGLSGNSLHEECQSSRDGLCFGFITGVFEGLRLGVALEEGGAQNEDEGRTLEQATARLQYCPPADATYRQLVDIAANFLEEHPEARHLSARVLIWGAMREAFPCRSIAEPLD